LGYKTFKKIEELLLDYGLLKAMEEMRGLFRDSI